MSCLKDFANAATDSYACLGGTSDDPTIPTSAARRMLSGRSCRPVSSSPGFGSDRDAGLLVVGIGIMNIMPVSVTERAREIGIRLAVGATEADVQFQLLSESVAISLLAHVSGVIAGRSLVAFPNHSAIGN